MPKLTNSVPKYRKHRQSGQVIVTLNGHDHLLGPWGTQTSKRKYDRLVAEWLARDRQPAVAAADLTVAELAARYWEHAKRKYTRRGQPTAEHFHVKTALQHLLRLYQDQLAAQFTPAHLKVARESMIPTGWARSYINQQVGVLVWMFKWAVVEGLLPPAVHAALDLVDGLRRGETIAHETKKVRCVDDATPRCNPDPQMTK
jgi:hypothetical protein